MSQNSSAYFCSICICSLSQTPWQESEKKRRCADSEVKIVATLCGHVFHDFCIRKWMNKPSKDGEIQPPSTCPNCRKTVSNRNLNQIFLTNEPESSRNSAERETLAAEIGKLRVEIKEIPDDLTQEKKTSKDYILRNAQLMHSVSSFKRKLTYENSVRRSVEELNFKLTHDRDHLENEVKMTSLRYQKLLAEVEGEKEKKQKNHRGGGSRRKCISPVSSETSAAIGPLKVAKMKTGMNHYPMAKEYPRSARIFPSESYHGTSTALSRSKSRNSSNLASEASAFPAPSASGRTLRSRSIPAPMPAAPVHPPEFFQPQLFQTCNYNLRRSSYKM